MAVKFKIEAIFKSIDRMTAPINKMQARVQRFTRSMRNGMRDVRRATRRLAGGMTTGLKRGAMVATGAFVALGVAISSVTDDIDVLAKLASGLDFDIEALQEWRFVAEQSGLTSAEFTKSLAKFSRTLGNARAGYGTMYSDLKKNNKVLLKMLVNTDDVAEAYGIYLNAIRKTPKAVDRAALASSAFGRAGTKVINMALESAEAIEALRLEQRQNGIVTQEQADRAQEYNDVLNSLKRSLGGLLQGVLLPLLPKLIDAGRFMRAWVVANKEMIATRVGDFLKKVIDNFDEIIEAVKDIAKGIAVFYAITAAVEVLTVAMGVFNVVASANIVGLIVAAVVALVAAMTAVFIWGEKIKAWFDGLSRFGKMLVVALGLLIGPLAWLTAAVVMLKVHFKKISQVASDVFGAISDAVASAVRTMDELLGPFFDALGVGFEEAPAAIASAWGGLADWFTELWNGIVGAFESAINFILRTGPLSWFIAEVLLIKKHWGPISDFFSAVWESITTVIGIAVGGIVDGSLWVLGAAADALIAAWDVVVAPWKAMWKLVSGMFVWGVEVIMGGPVKRLGDAAKATEALWSPVVRFFKNLWQDVVDIFDSAISKLGDIFEPVLDFFDKLSAAKDALIDEEIGKIDLGKLKIEEEVSNVVKLNLPDFIPPELAAQQSVPGEVLAKVLPFAKPVPGEVQGTKKAERFKPTVQSQHTSMLKTIEERTRREEAEITIRDETGRAEVTKGALSGNVRLENTGSF